MEAVRTLPWKLSWEAIEVGSWCHLIVPLQQASSRAVSDRVDSLAGTRYNDNPLRRRNRGMGVEWGECGTYFAIEWHQRAQGNSIRSLTTMTLAAPTAQTQ